MLAKSCDIQAQPVQNGRTRSGEVEAISVGSKGPICTVPALPMRLRLK